VDRLASRGGRVSAMPASSPIAAPLFAVAGVINLLPLSALAGSAAMQRLYGIDVSGADLQILLQHRAVLIGAAGAMLFFAAWMRRWRRPASVFGLFSMGTYLLIAFAVGGFNAALARVALADALAIGCVVLALLIDAGARRGGDAVTAQTASARNAS
jgi:hypothetical protein